ncbi:MAG: superinfection immunity protein [Chloroflexi bacterium]|nr:superinfection immunity protein [Chloroflexota bacterium]
MFQNFGIWQLFILAMYFVPTIVALVLDSRNKPQIILLNVLLGWLFGTGWIAALILAVVWRSNSSDEQ